MEAFDGQRGLGAPVLDPLGFVENDDIGFQASIDFEGVAAHLLIVDEGEERRGGIGLEAGVAWAEHHLIGQIGEASSHSVLREAGVMTSTRWALPMRCAEERRRRWLGWFCRAPFRRPEGLVR